MIRFLRRLFTRSNPGSEMLDRPAPESSAESGEAAALFRKGLNLACAPVAARDYAAAAQWYTQAAEQNHALAQFNLGVMYSQGQGVPRDDVKSLMWMTRAAQLGDAGAQYRVGMQQYLACREGLVEALPEKRIEALKWVQLSAAQGYRGAEGASQFLALGMSRDEVAEGGRRADAFGPGNQAVTL